MTNTNTKPVKPKLVSLLRLTMRRDMFLFLMAYTAFVTLLATIWPELAMLFLAVPAIAVQAHRSTVGILQQYRYAMDNYIMKKKLEAR